MHWTVPLEECSPHHNLRHLSVTFLNFYSTLGETAFHDFLLVIASFSVDVP